MVQRINVDAFLKPLGRGISKPMLILGSDYKRYILKNQKADHNGNIQNFNCMFLNELLAHQIGSFLEIPLPEAAIANLDKQFLNNDPAIRFAYRYVDGYHFASEELLNVENNYFENIHELMQMGKPYIIKSWNTFFDNIINKEDIAKIIAFDLLIANFDRYKNEGNILIDFIDSGRKIYAIDHGHAFFGPNWETNKVKWLHSAEPTQEYLDFFIGLAVENNKNSLDGLGNIFKALELHVDLTNPEFHPFQKIVKNIEMISEEYLDECLNSIPEEWFVDKANQIGYYKKFILTQKHLVRYFIQTLAQKNAFTNYRGGILQWIKEKEFGTAL